MQADTGSQAPFLTRLLQKLTDVRAEEIGAMLAAFLCLFAIFTGYAILRPLRDSMVLVGGIDTHTNFSPLFKWTFAGMLIAMPIYGWVASRFPRRIFLPVVYVFFILNLLAFYVVLSRHPDSTLAARVFYVWVSVVNLFVVSVFWSFMADTFSNEQAHRIFGFIAAGSSAGSVLGPTLTNMLVRSIGNANLLLVSICFWVVAIFLMSALLRRYSAGVGQAAEANRPPERPIGGNPFAGLTLVLKSRYLLGISLFIFLLSSASTLLYLQQQSLIESVISDKTMRTQLLSRIDIVVNILSILMQLFAVGRLTSRLGVTVMLVSVPVLMMLGFTVLAFAPVLAVLIGVMIARRAGEYAVMRPCREMLFTSVPRATKYKAKNFIDTVIYRFADWVNAIAHDAFVARGLATSGIAWIGVGAAAIWAAVAFSLGRRHQRQETPTDLARG
jgi:AAA family ATP:ADP antiporter